MNKKISIAIVLDPLESLNIKKDSTYAMIKEASSRNWDIYTIVPGNIFVDNSIVFGLFHRIEYHEPTSHSASWYTIIEQKKVAFGDLNITLIRKDPPFNMEYIYLTYMLDLAEQQGTLVANNPTAIRNNNEKLSTLKYNHVTPANLVTANKQKLLDFIQEYKSVIVKPLDGMGGRSIFKINEGDANTSVILDTITSYGNNTILAQQFIEEIKNGDKRILIVDGQPIPYGLARIPAKGEFRGNLAAGASGKGFELSERDKYICNYLGPKLKEQGLYFVGIDVIGDYLTEINVTSPTCIQEIDKIYSLNISKVYLDSLEKYLK